MTKNPFYNALVAVIYIVLVVLVVNLVTDIRALEESLLMPIMMISLFTLSAAVMGYIFCLQPLRLYLDGKKEEGISLFVKTIIIFAIIPFSIFLLYILKILPL